MAYQSKFTGATVDELLTVVQNWKADPDSMMEDIDKSAFWDKITEADILGKLSGDGIVGKFSDDNYSTIESKVWPKVSGQDVVDKINTVAGSIIFTKFVDAQAGAGDTTD